MSTQNSSRGTGGAVEHASDGKVSTTPEVSGLGPESTGGRDWRSRTLIRHGLLMLLAFVGIALLLESVSPFRATQLGVMAYYVPAVAGLTVLTGVNGQISLGHGALMAVGAYTTAWSLENVEGMPFLVVLLVAILVTMVVGLLVGIAAARLHGPYLAGATLALAVGLPGIAIYFEHTLGGEEGLRVSPPRAPEWLESAAQWVTGNELSGGKFTAYYGWAFALLVLFLLSNLITSRVGRVWRSVRDDEVAAELAGINLARARVLAFVVSAACAGLAGAMLAVVTRLASPPSFTLVLSILLLAAIVIGGLGSLVGAVIGSAILVFLPPFVTDLGLNLGLQSSRAADVAPLVFGIVLIVVMLAAPLGLVGTVRQKYLVRKARKAMAGAGSGS